MGFKVIKQYVKKINFEVPNAPIIFTKHIDNPDIEVSLDIDAKKLSENSHEVSLKIKAVADKGSLFELEIEYGGVFSNVSGINFDEENLQKTLLINCPNLLFPFVRAIIHETTSNAGFLPLMIDPVNFESLYYKRKENKIIN